MGPKQSGHGRYVRFNMMDVANIPARMLDEDDVYEPVAEPRLIHRLPRAPPAFESSGQPRSGNGAGPSRPLVPPSEESGVLAEPSDDDGSGGGEAGEESASAGSSHRPHPAAAILRAIIDAEAAEAALARAAESAAASPLGPAAHAVAVGRPVVAEVIDVDASSSDESFAQGRRAQSLSPPVPPSRRRSPAMTRSARGRGRGGRGRGRASTSDA